ncbi:MAG TPA: signal recognition particle receptor subunit alpha, partial [Candidatus Sumerlaeia bacterium]|nr:signal recognition particle receptor subunit alpha [Candidatus Sumerlaeia bacterium]
MFFWKKKPEEETQPQPAPSVPLEPENPEKKGFFSRLKDRLSKTKDSIITRVKEVIRLRGKVSEELLDEIEEILIQADVGVDTTMKIIDRIRKESRARGIEDSEPMIDLFKEVLLEIIQKN